MGTWWSLAALQHILAGGRGWSGGTAPSLALASSAATGSSGWARATGQASGGQGPRWRTVFEGFPASTVSFPQNDSWVPVLAGATPSSCLGVYIVPSGRGRFGTAGSMALRSGPGCHRFAVKPGGMCPRRPSTQVARAYPASGGCHVSTGKHPPSPDGQQPLQTWWARDGVQKVLCAGPDTGEEILGSGHQARAPSL